MSTLYECCKCGEAFDSVYTWEVGTEDWCGPCMVAEIEWLRAVCKILREGLEAIVGRDPASPGPKAAVCVGTSTMVAIAKQTLVAARATGGEE